LTPASGDDRRIWGGGQKYEAYVGRWSRVVARSFIRWLSPRAAASWLDVGAGTGALTATILEAASTSRVVAIDPSEAFIAYARAHLPAARAYVTVGDAQALPFSEGSFDVSVSGLVLNFVPRPARAVAELGRVTRPGGTVAAYVWDYAGEMQLIRRFWEAAAAVDAAAAALDEGRRFPITRPGPLAELFADADLEEVETLAIDIDTSFDDFDQLWSPFLGGQGPAPAYVASLSEKGRDQLREQLRRSLPVAADGRIALAARAWAVRGIRRG
jgi:SAM-dependent methyltransferase